MAKIVTENGISTYLGVSKNGVTSDAKPFSCLNVRGSVEDPPIETGASCLTAISREREPCDVAAEGKQNPEGSGACSRSGAPARMRSIRRVRLAVRRSFRPCRSHRTDLDARELRVVWALQRVHGRLRFVDLKTEAADRTVSIPKFAVPYLKRHQTRQRKERLALGAGWQEHGLGHSEIGVTMNTHTHVVPELRREAADALDELFGE